MNIGVLALQGDFKEHLQMLKKMGVPNIPIKLPTDLEKVDRLIIPGGESTTIGHLLTLYALMDPIQERVKKGMPIWGTCAGAILLAKKIEGGRSEGQSGLELMDITARRNAFGRQIDSFETTIDMPSISINSLNVFFIRAPILKFPAQNVTSLATLKDGTIVAAQQDKILATCFHPELTSDNRLHHYFANL